MSYECEVLYANTKDRMWINGADGSSVARFSNRAGMDIHNSATDQMKGMPECKYCTHTQPTEDDWNLFREKIKTYFGIDIPHDAINIIGKP